MTWRFSKRVNSLTQILNPLNPKRPTPCRDELMALRFGFGRGTEAREREGERDKRLDSPLALHDQRIH